MRTLVLLVFASLSFAVGAEKIALTFDDLPLNGSLQAGTSEVEVVERTLKILHARRVPPVFGFANAQKLESNPNGARALQLWVDGGQRIGNHSYSHINLNAHSVEDFARDVLRNEPALLLLSPKKDWRWFRFPYLREGATLEKRNGIRAFLTNNGYQIAQTTIDYEDYLWNSPFARCADQHDTKSIERLRNSYTLAATAALEASRRDARRVLGREIDHVLLLHLGAFTPDILPSLLDLLAAHGFELATLEDVQSDSIYQLGSQYLAGRGGTLLQQHLIAKKIDADPWPTLPRGELEDICR